MERDDSGRQAAFVPTEEQRLKVRSLVGGGVKQRAIANYLGISHCTLERHFKEEIADGMGFMGAIAVSQLNKKIVEGNLTAIIFYLKCKHGWREVNRHEISGIDGQPINLSSCPDADLARLIAALEMSIATRSGESGDDQEASTSLMGPGPWTTN